MLAAEPEHWAENWNSRTRAQARAASPSLLNFDAFYACCKFIDKEKTFVSHELHIRELHIRMNFLESFV